ncbi:MAG TPA: SPFH domain-containing protein [Solirubrobacterales bacterium]|nr:SPFH domain-containing protein [Solirubrobacterales bacterium]
MQTIIVAPAIAAAVTILVVVKSVHRIGPAEVGLVTKKLGFKRLGDDNPIAFAGEAGYQARLLMPGLRFRLWPVFSVARHPWVQVPAGEIGVVIAQVGAPLPIGAKSAVYRQEFGSFSDIETFLGAGGQKGVQRPVLPPGTLVPVHPVGFLVITSREVFGIPVAPELATMEDDGVLAPESFGLDPQQLRVVVIAPQGESDVVGVVTALEGTPVEKGDIASRLGGFDDVVALEADPTTTDAELIDTLLGSKNDLHNNYQDFQAFLEAGGRIGLQHDPLLYGAYLLNPFLVRVELVPMLVVNQGEVAVIKGFVGLPTLDTSGADFKFGSIVRPGHRGIWQEPLRTGKYPLNPRVYAAEIVPTFILTLNWAAAQSQAHDLDARLEPIVGKSREGFVFTIDLQVQIHVSDTRAPKVISMVATMQNLVNEVLQSAVGNHFRNTLQNLEAVRFIETRQQVQQAAFEAVRSYLAAYEVETRGVYIQDVIFPPELVEVLTKREIANQERTTYAEEQRAETARIEMEKARGTADMQAELAASQVSVDINANRARAREAEAQGEAAYVRTTGRAEADRTEAIGLAEARATEALGLARAAGFEAQRAAIGEGGTALVAVTSAIADGGVDIMPDVLVTGGGGALDGLAATLMGMLRTNGTPPRAPAPAAVPEVAEAAEEPVYDDPEAVLVPAGAEAHLTRRRRRPPAAES